MELIETVRVERGRAVLLPYHYRRLRRGALSLGFPLNLSEQDFEKLLVKRWKEDGGGTKLVRFSLSENGSFN
ncbi:MAG: aminotransferase class IV, partial [Desulfurobacteriaceae bacterium]